SGSQNNASKAAARCAVWDRGRLARSAPQGPRCAAAATNIEVPARARMRARCPRSAETLALAAAAIVALNPQFIYQSAAINNDIVAALSGTALLLACVVLLREGLSLRRLAGLGVVAGVALLSKLQIAAIGPAVALSLALAARRGPVRRRLLLWLRALLVVGIIAGAVCGWWYLRNLRLYGDITGMNKLDEIWVGRDAADNLWAIQQGLPQLWASLWARFGYGQIPVPGAMTTAMALICAAGLTGLVRSRKQRIAPSILATLGLAILGVTAIVAYYMARQPAGAMGRFLFPVLPAFAVLLVAGIDAWLQSPARTRTIVTAGMGLFAAVALLGYLWPAIAYPPRKLLPSGVQAQVGDIARILSATVDQDEVAPGDAVFVRVNWEPLRWTEEPLTVFVHLIDEAGIVVAQRDTWPGLSRAATTSWRAGIPFVDTYRVDLPETLYSPNTLTVSIGLYGSTVGRVPIAVEDPAAASAAAVDSLPVGTLTVSRQAGAWANPIDVNFGNEIRLVGYEITPRVVAPGGTTTLTLTWDLPAPLAVDPYIFAQVVDADWNVWGSNDGGHPEWRTGIVTDTRRITLIPETPAGSYPVNVGLVSEGKRLRIIADDGSLLGDFVSLGPIGVR
ncbi:MAG: glycosyltransferase family 39 protein, partial [Anaerolineae bacterium]|nr:glycosyltransferase family 39 protein [Anaerolineae bacterium]